MSFAAGFRERFLRPPNGGNGYVNRAFRARLAIAVDIYRRADMNMLVEFVPAHHFQQRPSNIVCPENAIVFPQHKDTGIAGAAGEVANLKIDLSGLFGAPDAMELAARERDIELVRDGLDAVGMSVGIPRRQKTPAVRDDLDDLIDGLDELDL